MLPPAIKQRVRESFDRAAGTYDGAARVQRHVCKRLLEQLNLPARDCLVVEDSAHGLAASLAAGIPTVITLSDYTHDEDFEGARMVLHETENLSLDKLRLWHATASTS